MIVAFTLSCHKGEEQKCKTPYSYTLLLHPYSDLGVFTHYYKAVSSAANFVVTSHKPASFVVLCICSRLLPNETR